MKIAKNKKIPYSEYFTDATFSIKGTNETVDVIFYLREDCGYDFLN